MVDETKTSDAGDAKAKAEAEAKAKAAAEAKARADAADAARLIPVSKDGETIRVHPETLDEHIAIGWQVASKK